MEKRITGRTGLLALFGSPVGHSGSPAMYNFSFQHGGLDYAYMAFDIKEDQMEEALKSVKLLNMRGCNVTMPCKNIAAKLVDEISPAARIIGACNTIVNDNGTLVGHITDGTGFVRNLEEEGVDIKDKKLVVLGAGGAGTALQVQCALDGAKEIAIFNVKDAFFERALDTAKKIEKEAPNCVVHVYDIEDKGLLAKEIESADILVNSTMIGMKPYQDRSLVEKEWLRKDLVVADTIYNPEKTKLILEAEEIGCKAIGGKGMLLWQGAAAYQLYTGQEMPTKEYQEFQRSQI
ncbi:quinate/shikimate dehydrogenase [Aequitasia blattaphilus]|uniref:Shikimate dehydrogenase (NADP(+)) n=1 Tax=Aequitasia blattaphilus TaxID=2949332 RepID=A0ABT1E4T5_9FIRM|nr:shikimate dehydrogenase [Aequitasia blattaphilus]MCP1100844.1 shikimate dehydrogenase [Aequitasia blattaphilus]MCR8613484.1 shikimate dehydrogenase [Aequitasia blattaphilus]